MVRIHAGQPISLSKTSIQALLTAPLPKGLLPCPTSQGPLPRQRVRALAGVTTIVNSLGSVAYPADIPCCPEGLASSVVAPPSGRQIHPGVESRISRSRAPFGQNLGASRKQTQRIIRAFHQGFKRILAEYRGGGAQIRGPFQRSPGAGAVLSPGPSVRCRQILAHTIGRVGPKFVGIIVAQIPKFIHELSIRATKKLLVTAEVWVVSQSPIRIKIRWRSQGG